MTPPRSGAALDFAEARLSAERAGVLNQRQAAKRVAEHSLDVGDCRELLAMLGLADLPPLAPDVLTLTDQHTTPTFPEAFDVFRPAGGVRG